MNYHGWKPTEETLTFPTVEEPVKLIGPSSLSIVQSATGCKYDAHLWVGGEGLAIDGRWGENFTFTFTVPHDLEIDVRAHAGILLMKYQRQIINMYGEEVGEAVIHAIGQIVSRRFYRKGYTPAEIMENVDG